MVQSGAQQTPSGGQQQWEMLRKKRVPGAGSGLDDWRALSTTAVGRTQARPRRKSPCACCQLGDNVYAWGVS